MCPKGRSHCNHGCENIKCHPKKGGRQEEEKRKVMWKTRKDTEYETESNISSKKGLTRKDYNKREMA
jgi:hypothetical protein